MSIDLSRLWELYSGGKDPGPTPTTFPDDLDVEIKQERSPSPEKRVLEELDQRSDMPPPRPRPVGEPTKRKRSRVIFEKDMDTRVLPLNQLPIKEQDAFFLRKLEKISQINSNRKNLLPDKASVLRYVASLPKDERPAYIDTNSARLIAANRKYPVQQVLCHAYIENFLREPIGDERPCSHVSCQSVEMGGFRCRELIMPGEKTTRPALHGWCYLCHLFETWRLYTLGLNPKIKQFVSNKVYSIHHFIVKVDEIGEYRLDKTYLGDQDVVGVFGPVPIFNRNFYTLDDTKSVKTWKESESLLFRPPQKVSDQTTSSPIIRRDGENN